MATVQMEDNVVFVDSLGKPHKALVTAVWGQTVFDPKSNPPSVNLIIVSDDQAKSDSYGRQVERHTSVVYLSRQPSVDVGVAGYYWRFPYADEIKNVEGLEGISQQIVLRTNDRL